MVIDENVFLIKVCFELNFHLVENLKETQQDYVCSLGSLYPCSVPVVVSHLSVLLSCGQNASRIFTLGVWQNVLLVLNKNGKE